MTALPEAKLAREAELCYAMIATVTDYDAWHEGHAAVDAATILRVLSGNVEMSREIVRQLAGNLPAGDCPCRHSLDAALITQPAAISDVVRTRLGPILARRLQMEEMPA
jgi:5'-methylthioadenosine phosphorylase